MLRKYEVLKWDEAGADVKWTELDEAKKPVKGGKSQSLRVEFKEGESAKFALPEGASKSRVEKRRFGPNVLECTVYTFRQEGKEGQIWISNLYPAWSCAKRWTAASRASRSCLSSSSDAFLKGVRLCKYALPGGFCRIPGSAFSFAWQSGKGAC